MQMQVGECVLGSVVSMSMGKLYIILVLSLAKHQSSKIPWKRILEN